MTRAYRPVGESFVLVVNELTAREVWELGEDRRQSMIDWLGPRHVNALRTCRMTAEVVDAPIIRCHIHNWPVIHATVSTVGPTRCEFAGYDVDVLVDDLDAFPAWWRPAAIYG